MAISLGILTQHFQTNPCGAPQKSIVRISKTLCMLLMKHILVHTISQCLMWTWPWYLQGMLCHLAFGYVLDVFWEPRSLLSMGEYLIILAGQNLRIFSPVFKTLRLQTFDFEGYCFCKLRLCCRHFSWWCAHLSPILWLFWILAFPAFSWLCWLCYLC